MSTYVYNPNDYKKPHLAQPSFNSHVDDRVFPDRRQAVRYLNAVTKYYLRAEDWAIIGKLRPVK